MVVVLPVPGGPQDERDPLLHSLFYSFPLFRVGQLTVDVVGSRLMTLDQYPHWGMQLNNLNAISPVDRELIRNGLLQALL